MEASDIRSDARFATLVAVPVRAGISAESAGKAAVLCGADAYRLELLLRSGRLTTLARGEPEGIEAAARFLQEKGVRCASVSNADVRMVPRPAHAGGVAAEEGGVGLRVHGRAAGPPAGAPLLLVFGDLARSSEGSAPAARRVADTLSQRVLRAQQPVVEVAWPAGRIRVALKAMTWIGLPGLGPSAVQNFIRLIETLVGQSGGAVLDLGFEGQELAGPSALAGLEPIEGADRETVARFDRYAAMAVAAWRKGLYPAASAGKFVLAGGELSPESAQRLSASPGKAAAASPIPWIRRAGKSRTRVSFWPWLLGAPFALLFLFGGRIEARRAALAFAACGFAVAGLGVSALVRRERVRSVPQARVRSMALGPVELQGRVAGCATFVSPFSRTSCAWYRFEVQESSEDGPGRGWSRATETGGSGDAPFWLDDGTASVLVQPAEAEVDVEPRETALASTTRAIEYLLEEGETVFIAGFAQRRSTDSAGVLREGVSAAPARDDVFVGSAPGQTFVISRRSRSAEASRLTREFAIGAFLGVAYLVTALVIFLRSPF